MKDFSIKEYLISNKLASEKGKLIATDSLPNPAWGIGPYAEWEAMIYLCTLVHFFNEKGMLDNLTFSLKNSDDFYYSIFIDEIDRSQSDYNFDWSIIIDMLDFLIPHMAGSNVTYLSGQLFWEN
jgi:hypothetical protein